MIAQGKSAAAIETLQAVAPSTRARPLRLEQTQLQIALARADLQRDRVQQSIDRARQALAHIEASPMRERYPSLEADAALAVGMAMRKGGDAANARRYVERAWQLGRDNGAKDGPALAEAQVELAECLLDLGDAKAARTLLHDVRGKPPMQRVVEKAGREQPKAASTLLPGRRRGI